eukprot:Em0021g770a
MNEKIRNAEDLSSFMKSTRPSAVSQMAVPGHIRPHSGFTLSSESIAIPATHHPLASAYPIMRPSLGMTTHMPMTTLTVGKARTTPPADALGPPMFMPSLNLGTPKSTSSNATSYSKPKGNSITFSQPNSPMMAAGGEMLSGTITNSQSSFPLLTNSSLSYAAYPIQQAAPQQPFSLSQSSPSSSSSSPLPNMNSKPPGSQSIAKPAPPTSAQSTSTSKAKASSKSSSFGAKPGYSNSIVRPASPSSVARIKEGDLQQPSLESGQFFYGSGGQLYISQGSLMIHPSMQLQPQSHPSMQQQSQSHPSMQQQSQSHPSMQQQSQSHPSMQQQSQSHPAMQQQSQSHPAMQQQSQSHPSMQQQSQSHPAMPPQPPSLPQTQPQSTLSKLLAPSQASKPAADVSPGPPAIPAAPPVSQATAPSAKSAGTTVGRSNHTPADRQQPCQSAVSSVAAKAAAALPFSASLLTTAGQLTTAAVVTDTRVDRPPQPLVSSSSNGGSISSSTFPQVTMKDRFDGPTLINNITGRPVAPLLPSLSTTDVQSAYDHSNAAPCTLPSPTPPQTFTLGAAALHLPSQQAFLLGAQQGGGYPLGQVIQQQQQGLVLPSSPGSGNGTNVGLAAAISSASSSTLSPGSASPRPRILRKRALDGDIKMMEWQITSTTSANFINNLPTRPIAPGHVTPVDPPVSGGVGVSCPLSPVDHLSNNHLAIKQETSVESLTSPRKKPRKQNVIPSDDHYATNVPNNEDSTFVAPPPVEAYSGGPREEVGEKIKAKREDLLCTEQVPKSIEPRCWKHLHRSPFPINGVYQVYHRAARNHFRRHADIKHREEDHVSIQDVANDQSSYPRARGWKLKHFSTQLLEMVDVEHGILTRMEKLLDTVCSLSPCASFEFDGNSLNVCKELVQGNVDRSKRVISDLQDTQKGMSSVLEHRHHVLDLLNQYSTERPVSNGSVAVTAGVLKSRDRT